MANVNNDMTSDGGDQFKGSNLRANPSKAVYGSVGQIPITTSLPEIMTTAHSAVSGQVSAHTSSSQYLQPATIKSVEQQQLSGT